MIGVGPYIPHPGTPLGKRHDELKASPDQPVPNSEAMTYKVVALTRLVRPQGNIPSTTALATLNKNTGRELGMSRGANIVMPNVTPTEYRVLYEIYPNKTCLDETGEECHACMRRRILSIGRIPGTGRGDSPNSNPTAPIRYAEETPTPVGIGRALPLVK
jgi:biotin synthase